MQLHPDQRQALESPVTIVKRIEQAAQYPVSSGLLFFTLHQISSDLFDQIRILKIRRKSRLKVPLEAVPYSEEYKDHLSKSANFLKEVKHFSSSRLVLILIFSLHYNVFAFVPFSFVAFQVSFTRLRTRRTTLRWPSFSEHELRYLFLSN